MSKVITKETYEKLKKELERLKTEERKRIAEKIKTAKEFGDLSENAEYQSALEEQKKLELRILELENLLKTAKVVKKERKKSNKIEIGSEIEIVDLDSKKTLKFKIVGFGEANPLENKISQESPIGKALIGKTINEIVEIQIGNTKKRFKIKKIS
jgi:transcription elongation factor GreA